MCPPCGKSGFDPWVEKIPWRRALQPTLVFLPGESHGWRSLVGYHEVTKSWWLSTGLGIRRGSLVTKLGICSFASSCHFSLVSVETWIQITLVRQRLHGAGLEARLQTPRLHQAAAALPLPLSSQDPSLGAPCLCTDLVRAWIPEEYVCCAHIMKLLLRILPSHLSTVALALSLLLQLMQIQAAFVEEKSALGNRFAGPLGKQLTSRPIASWEPALPGLCTEG